MNYQQKYLKYKTKYLQLKLQLGSGFKQGDLVIVNGTNKGGRTYKDAKATIILIDDNGIILVKFDNRKLGIYNSKFGKSTDEVDVSMITLISNVNNNVNNKIVA